MGVLFPYFLTGLVALAVPVIIHLWSKSTRKSVDFGSIRFLRETETKTMRSIMPSQWLLLLLRMILIALLVLLMAEPFMQRKIAEVNTMYLVDPKYKDLAWFQSFKDSLSEGEQAFWLANGFPDLSEEVSDEATDYWQLLADPPSLNVKKTVVISPLLMKDFQGVKASFPVKYEWMKLPSDPLAESMLSYQKNGQSFQVNTTFDEWKTVHTLEKTSGAEPIVISYYLQYSPEFELYRKMFETALNTLNELSALTINQSSNIADADWIFWLSKESIPTQANIVSIDSMSVKKWKKVGAKRIHISNDWSMQDAVDQNLPKKLLTLLSPTIPNDIDQRTMDLDSFMYNEVEQNEIRYAKQNSSSIFWVLLLVGLIVERWVSHKSDKP